MVNFLRGTRRVKTNSGRLEQGQQFLGRIFQMRTCRLEAWEDLGHRAPKSGTVIHLLQVREFVSDDIID